VSHLFRGRRSDGKGWEGTNAASIAAFRYNGSMHRPFHPAIARAAAAAPAA